MLSTAQSQARRHAAGSGLQLLNKKETKAVCKCATPACNQRIKQLIRQTLVRPGAKQARQGSRALRKIQAGSHARSAPNAHAQTHRTC